MIGATAQSIVQPRSPELAFLFKGLFPFCSRYASVMSERHCYEEGTRSTMDVDSKLSIDEENVSPLTNFSDVYNNENTTMLPLTLGTTQISPYGTNGEVDRDLFAPTPPLLMTECDMNQASFLSPTTAEPQSSYNDPSPAAIIAADSFQSDHRHVTPMPLDAVSPTPPLMSDSIEVTTNTSNDTAIDTADTNTFAPQNDAASMNTHHSITSEKSMGRTLPRHIAYTQYNVSVHFPVIVHRMITEACQRHGPSLMRWTDCGEYFWIEQKHAMLSPVLAQYFKHNRYQSLRRQLNAYKFGKIKTGIRKGYWKHPKFRRDSAFTTLKSIESEPRYNNRKKKNIKMRAAKLAADPKQMKKLDRPPVIAKSFSSIKLAPTEILMPNNEVSKLNMYRDKAHMQEVDDSYKNKIYSGERRKSKLGLDQETTKFYGMHALTSKSEVDDLQIDDPLLSEPDLDLGCEIAAFSDDSSSDALTALATIASFLPIAPMPLYTPIAKNLDIIRPIPINQPAPTKTVVSPQDIKMTILAETAFWFCPTPIKVPSGTTGSCDPVLSGSDSTEYNFDDSISSYSVGSLSSPMKLILPFSDRSAFTPVVSSTDRMVAEFCESFF